MCDDKPLPANDSLDQAIHQALRVEVDQERLVRLEHSWTIQSQSQRRRRLALRLLPVAAAVLVMITAFALRRNLSEDSQLAENKQDAAPSGEYSELDALLLSKKEQPGENLLSAGRPASAYERLVFLARTNAQLSASTKAVRIDRAINQLAMDPSVDIKQTLASSGLEPADAETRLLKRLPRVTSSLQAVIFRLLGVCGTERSIPVLLQFGKQKMLRESALTAIEQIVGVDHLAEVVGFTGDFKLRTELMLRLLSADSDAAIRRYLSLVRIEAMRLEALAVAKHAPQLPIATLLAFLDDKDKHVRLSAALVLGYVNGPDVTQRLIARVTSQPSGSTEAWLALQACRGDLAEEFLSYATQQPKLLGHCNYARVQWTQIIH